MIRFSLLITPSVLVQLFSFIGLLIISLSGYTQDRKNLDHLFRDLEIAASDTKKIKLLKEIGDMFFNDPDSSQYYYHEALTTAKKLEDTKSQSSLYLSLARANYMLQNFYKAINYVDTSLLLAQINRHDTMVGNCFRQIGSIYIAQGKANEAIDYYKKSLEQFKVINDSFSMAWPYGKIGEALAVSGRYAESIEYFSKALKLTQDEWLKEIVINGLMYCSQVEGDYEKALRYSFYKLDLAKRDGQSSGIRGSLMSVGLVYSLLENYAESFAFFDKALSIKGGTQMEYHFGMINKYIASNYYQQSNFALALKYNIISLEWAHENRDQITISRAYQGIADVLIAQKNYKEALKNYMFSMNILKNLNDPRGEAHLYHAVGETYGFLGDISTAVLYYKTSLKNSEQLGDKNLTVKNLMSLGILEYDLKNYQTALQIFLEALSITDALDENSNRAYMFIHIGLIYSKIGEQIESIFYLKKGVSLAKNLNNASLLSTGYYHLSMAYDKQNVNKAYEYYKLHVKIKDSLFNEKQSEQLITIQTQYETEKKEHRIQAQKDEIEHQALDIKLSNTEIELLKNEQKLKSGTIFGLVLGGTLVIALGFFIVLFQRLRLRARRLEITNQEAELTNFAVYLQNNSELIEELSAKLSNLSNGSNKVESIKLRELSNQIKNIQQIDKDRSRFKLLIEEKHQLFFKKLIKKHPNLTEREKHLCSLLLLDFSSKDIANIFNVASKSVDMYRYNLRKKLSLPSELAFPDYFKKL